MLRVSHVLYRAWQLVRREAAPGLLQTAMTPVMLRVAGKMMLVRLLLYR